MNELEQFLIQQYRDQGGEATFQDWLEATAEDPTELFHEEALVWSRFIKGEYRQ